MMSNNKEVDTANFKMYDAHEVGGVAEAKPGEL